MSYEDSGGFDNDDNQSSQVPKKYRDRNFDVQNLIPICVMQAVYAENTAEDTFKIEKVEINMVSLVGKVVSVTPKNNRISFTIEDVSGKIEVNLISKIREEVVEHQYVRIYGFLRRWKDQTNILAVSLKKVTDFNEITFHTLDVIYSTLYLRKGLLPQESTKSAYTQAKKSSYQSQPSSQYVAPSTSNTLDDKVVDSVKNTISNLSENSSTGVRKRTIVESLAGHYSEAEVKDAIDKLVDNGDVYCTEEDFFKSN
ncbi:replication factor A2 [Acrasis kona]|uniref:Replication factor A2 n=1 Tax=Acrasis kona TaxID=1008807 RepID=A0AAW2YGW2_9EUKA